MDLKNLIKELEVESIYGPIDVQIDNIHYDSRLIKPGGLFICIEGFMTDGHNYINEAIENGAVAIAVEKEIHEDRVPIIRFKNTRRAMASIASNFYGKPSQLLDMIGVTGTNGKTSVTYIIKSILENYDRKTAIIGTLATLINNEKMYSARTTPESLDLQGLFRKMIDGDVDTCIMEVSSHSLELNRVDEVSFKVGIFTNLTPDHLDFHSTMDNYREAKKKLFYKTTHCNIINLDDEAGRIIVKDIKNLDTPLLTYSINNPADFVAENIHNNGKELSFDVVGPENFNIKLTLKTPALFAVYNALASIACCYSLGVPADIIADGLNAFIGVPGRFQSIDGLKEFSAVVDYAHTPDALENVLKAAKEFTKNKLITVFGCGGDRDQTKRPVMGEIAGKYSDFSIITSDNPRSEDPYVILSMIEEGIKRTKGNYIIIEDRKEAIREAVKMAEAGDLIVIAGKGHETTQIVKDRVLVFDDKQVVLEVAGEEGRI
ncbi:UDP-N-acetylmuramoyl-L-alanyl-D-glutamate--2,6-diaminopimelate ligase [Alkaliphilus serpentinus]|uniref:UDP-N-acetylmuramoyl-L-alanyl-D-glutamate--2,6-diaminopimelate ligase n=1 Tax=Alkaliphilus serpentinus TaxID=1482731 RepID=A0A833HRD0_9FIRM|nr:UDP-N-acetylmuramoyl-L-alanyl-D-glutamate--2,6-diaminopimelate ligase [Alkaliphilus serpentinus]KAB3533198.1 UDP-N-acetylmuramoyl-L-alanyl-D-glutamate--2,6-diaminopimelate ligase [Alkaliphilus serpentinus]